MKFTLAPHIIVVVLCASWMHLATAELCCAGSAGTHEWAANSLDEIYDRLAFHRKLQIERLHSYAARGKFPQNVDFPGQLIPYFVDRSGTACAVGHLMRLDGHQTLVDAIAAQSNHIRIEAVSQGPLVEWIHNSGLTHTECALIQPSYACIEDYRQGMEWQNEVKRLQEHFAAVEQALMGQSQKSLKEALLAKVSAELQSNPNAPIFTTTALASSLRSPEPNVRIAAAYVLARLAPEQMSRKHRIEILKPNLIDSDPAVRFWTAVALEKIGAASQRGTMELHSLTLPVFLEAFRGNQQDIRLAALCQLANVTPECIGSNMQLRSVPDIRRAMVDACQDKDPGIRAFAHTIMPTFRWRRISYESARMRRHYLNDSYDLECLASETLALQREFADQPQSVNELTQHQELYDASESILYWLGVGRQMAVQTAATEPEAAQLVDEWFRTIFSQYLDGDNPPSWRIESVKPNSSNLNYVVTALRTDRSGGREMPRPLLIYVVPRPDMLSEASASPNDWFETIHAGQKVWPASAPITIRPRQRTRVVLGNVARDDREAFTESCDHFAQFMGHRGQIVIDREVQESADALNWSGRFASLRQYNPRFFEQGGGGSSVYGGGGWDFNRLSMTCDRKTGLLTLSAEPISYAPTPVATDLLQPAWANEELVLMGWKPLDSIDFFGDRLLPPEYCEAVGNFDPNDRGKSYQLLYRTWSHEKSLPNPHLVLALLYDRAGNRENALQAIRNATSDGARDPATLADVARWELSVGMHDSALKHANEVLQIWPDQVVAKEIVKELDSAKSPSE